MSGEMVQACPTCEGRGWVHGNCNFRPGPCAGESLGRGCLESWPCPNEAFHFVRKDQSND